MTINSRSKGQRGEREVIRILQPIIDRVYTGKGKEPPQLERNLMQWAKGGYDLNNDFGMAIEVKYQEKDYDPAWWRQTVRQAGERLPVLFFRRNRVKWKVQTLGSIPGSELLVPVILTLDDWLFCFEKYLQQLP